MMNIQLYEEISENDPVNNLILIFTEGTILGPRNILDHFNHKKYIPIKNCIKKLEKWQEQGWQISYLTSRRTLKDVNEIKRILSINRFPGKMLYFRGLGQKYKEVVEEVLPNILVEDDCCSIGGKWQMSITYVRPEIKMKIKSIVVKEWHGIDDLPDVVSELLNTK